MWAQWLRLSVCSQEHVVVVNIDETAMAQLVQHRRGHVFRRPAGDEVELDAFERIGRRESHGHLTLVAAVTSEPLLQPVLEQWILPKDTTLTRVEKARFSELRAPLAWLRGTTGWVTQHNFCFILTCLRRTVASMFPASRLIVVLDTASQHMSDVVLDHAARLRIHLLCVPGRLTWLLQPLDTHVFAQLKQHLHVLQADARAASRSGCLEAGAWVSLLEQAVRTTLVERNWSHAVLANGCTGDFSHLRARVAACLGQGLPLPLRAPDDAEMNAIVGNRRPGMAGRVTRAAIVRLARLAALGPVPRASRLPSAAARALSASSV